MRHIVSLTSATLVAWLAAGCGGPPPALLPTASVTASFPARGLADVIVVDTVDRLPLRAATLIAPDGTATPGAVDVNARPGYEGGQRIALDPARSAVAVTQSALARGTSQDLTAATVQSVSRLDVMISTASIALPDPVAYRRDWARYKIRLDYGKSPATAETREIDAPAPPPPG